MVCHPLDEFPVLGTWLHGTHTRHYWNGVRSCEAEFNMGMRHGHCKGWLPDGTLLFHYIYEKGRIKEYILEVKEWWIFENAQKAVACGVPKEDYGARWNTIL